MDESITYVGLDVHQEEIVVAALQGSSKRPLELRVSGDERGMKKLVRRLHKVSGGGGVECAYEAGRCGYVPQRQLEAAEFGCTVAAPSLIPVKPGEWIKTDRRDARKLAEQHRAGLLTAVCPPSEAAEAARDLCRCREDLMRARHRLSKMLLRFGSPRQLMAYLGLVPSEHSSGGSRRQGGITKSGNQHVRRALVNAAWHYRHRPGVGVKLRQRRQGQPGAMVSLADRAQHRLHRRFMYLLLGRGKPSQKAVVAIARELVGFSGFLWAALVAYPLNPPKPVH